MKTASIARYDSPAHFEPLLPDERACVRLAERSRPMLEAALRLQGALPQETRSELRDLVREMNSYYSNLIEGQSAHPIHIKEALRKDFSAKANVAKRQRIALAHIEAERELEGLALSEANAFRGETLRLAHEFLYRRLSVDDRKTDEGLDVIPGEWRRQQVAVYRHEPPIWESIPKFLERTDNVYARNWSLEGLMVATACAHHRLIWVHPLLDGNGRACRLQTHAILRSVTDELWSVNRGLARHRDDYYRFLSEADIPRQGDLDGRGNLSQKMLVQWCEFFSDMCQDQVDFMTKTLQISTLQKRMEALIRVRSAERTGYREELIQPLLHVLAVGPLARGDFQRMTGLGEVTARKSMSVLLDDGLLRSDSHKSEVRLGLPLDSLNILFPNLYPEAVTAPME